MSVGMIFLIVFSSVFGASLTLGVIIFRFIDGRWPRWLTNLVFSTVPTSKETACRLLAASIVADEGNLWTFNGAREAHCSALGVSIRLGFDSQVTMTLDGKTVPCGARDEFEIRRAMKRHVAAANSRYSELALRLAAARLSDRLHALKEAA